MTLLETPGKSNPRPDSFFFLKHSSVMTVR